MNSAGNKRYFLLNKPTGMVSQFVSSHPVTLLGDLDFDFPEGTHAIGRLDRDSEGLLLLTTDKSVTRKVFLSVRPHTRSYLVMVQNTVTAQTLKKINDGIPLTIKNGETYIAKPVSAELINEPEKLYPYTTDPREAYPHSWLLITLTEGKFRQVRKMVLAVKHRCIRLIRLRISNIELGSIRPGEVKEIPEKLFYALLEEG